MQILVVCFAWRSGDISARAACYYTIYVVVFRYEKGRLVPGRVIVSVLPGIDSTGKTVEQLMEETWNIMNTEFVKLNVEVSNGLFVDGKTEKKTQ